MKRRVAMGILVLWTLLNASCGYELRGDWEGQSLSMYLQSEGADQIAEQVKRILSEEGVVFVSPQEARLILHLRDENMDRQLLSVSAVSGKLEELELTYRVEIEIEGVDEKTLLPKRVIRLSRDYSFDETAVLAMGHEEEVLRQDLLQEMVSQVRRFVVRAATHQMPVNGAGIEHAPTDTGKSAR